MTQAVYLISAYRSAIGKALRGSLALMRPDDFAADILRETVKRSVTFDPALIEDVMIGCAMPEAEQGMNVARFISLLAGLPDSVPAVTVNRFCSSGLQTIGMAADRIRAGSADCMVAGGVESMSLIPMMGHKVVGSKRVLDDHPDFYLGMGLTAENVANDYRISRADQDQFAFESHRKATTAIEKGWFRDEIIPLQVTRRTPAENGSIKSEVMTFDRDEGPRPDTSVEALAKLPAAFRVGGSVTAGNSSQMSDGAAMSVLVSERFLKQHKLTPIARVIGFEVAGVPPRVMGIGPVAAIPKLLSKAGMKIEAIHRVELNEAFASQALAVVRELKLDPEIVNPTGGAIALGHPLGATGAKLAATLLHGMKRDKQKFGIVSMCIGTGMGAAGLFELC
jgi:acetyl-CoA acyltransferase